VPTNTEIAQIFPAMCQRFLPEKAEGINAYIQFDLSGDNGGLYWLRIADGKCESGEGQADSPKMTLRAAADDYYSVVSGTMNPMQAFTSGRVKIQGDMGLAMKLMTMFATD
jgi:putative sterol carrier protein